MSLVTPQPILCSSAELTSRQPVLDLPRITLAAHAFARYLFTVLGEENDLASRTHTLAGLRFSRAQGNAMLSVCPNAYSDGTITLTPNTHGYTISPPTQLPRAVQRFSHVPPPAGSAAACARHARWG